MSNRAIPAVLIVLLVVVHAQLWFGRGSVPNVTSLQRKLDQQKLANTRAHTANEQLSSEVEDLKAGHYFANLRGAPPLWA